jgi:hypothetical protein
VDTGTLKNGVAAQARAGSWCACGCRGDFELTEKGLVNVTSPFSVSFADYILK